LFKKSGKNDAWIGESSTKTSHILRELAACFFPYSNECRPEERANAGAAEYFLDKADITQISKGRSEESLYRGPGRL